MIAYHNHTPEDEKTDDGGSRGWGGQRLGEGCKDDDDQLKSVHTLTADNIGEVTETKLTENSSTRCSDLDGGVRVGWDGTLVALLPEHNTQHGSHQVNGEDLLHRSEAAPCASCDKLTSYESVKKPIPATTQARTWYHPNGALSISASARRLRSLGSWMWAKSLWKLWKAAFPPDVLVTGAATSGVAIVSRRYMSSRQIKD